MIREADPIVPGGSTTGGAVVSSYLSLNVFGSSVPFYDTVEIPFNQQFVNTLIQSLPTGNVVLSRYNPSSAYTVYRGILRVGTSGPFRSFSFFPPNLSYQQTWSYRTTSNGDARTLLVLDEPLPNAVGWDNGLINGLYGSGVGIEIYRPPVPLEGVEPLSLPQGIVIDLGQIPSPSGYPATLTIDPSTQRLTQLTPRMTSVTLLRPQGCRSISVTTSCSVPGAM